MNNSNLRSFLTYSTTRPRIGEFDKKFYDLDHFFQLSKISLFIISFHSHSSTPSEMICIVYVCKAFAPCLLSSSQDSSHIKCAYDHIPVRILISRGIGVYDQALRRYHRTQFYQREKCVY